MRNDEKRGLLDAVSRAVGLMFGALLLTKAAHAEVRVLAPANPTYASECGSCHLAYPPHLLSAASWQRVMQSLERHFGTDASIDTRADAEISAYLSANAGNERRFGVTSMRISETRWFAREHEEVPAGIWKNPTVKSAANCGACHTRADVGDYRERNVRLPR
jgi:nitrate/TMAO reductase-like tetraheme cytochrome c subunit